MRDLLRGYATATFESAAAAGHTRQVANDLDEFMRVLMDSEPLHNVLTDVAIPPRRGRGVVRDLLEGKAASESGSSCPGPCLSSPPPRSPRRCSI